MHDFELCLNLNDELFEIIKPPLSFNELLEVVKQCFDLTKLNMYFLDEEDEFQLISSDADYHECLDYFESNNLKEGEIYIDGNKEKRKKSTSLRKQSKTYIVKKEEEKDEEEYGNI